MDALLGLIVSAWLGIIAILSVQNATLVTVRVLGQQTVLIPVGVALAFAVMAGILATVLLQPVWRLTAPRRKRLRANTNVANTNV
jgi:uncharacterized integral membrane protein